MTIDDRQYQDVQAFAWAMLASRDLDPIYDVLRALYADLALGQEQRLWFTALYLAYYNLPSALHAFRAAPEPDMLPAALARLPLATERRNLYAGKLLRHIDSYLGHVAAVGSQYAFATQRWRIDQPEQNFLRFWQTAQQPWGNGRWAAFKWADLLKNVHGLPIAAPDMRLAECSGPKEGLQRVYRTRTDDVAQLDQLGADLRERLARDGLLLDWEQLETVLCNFKSLAKGKYYVGHDIDELQERITHATFLRSGDAALLWGARRAALPLSYLGEWLGWEGVQRDRMRAYATRGEIVVQSL